MKAKSWVAAAALAGFIGVSEAPAEQVRFKTMEMRTMAGQQEPDFVQVARHRTTVQRSYHTTSSPRYVVKCRSKKKSAAIVGGSALGAGSLYDRKTHKKTVQVH